MKYPNINTTETIFELEDLLNKLNSESRACDTVQIQFMVISIRHKPHKRGFLPKQMYKMSAWLLRKIGFEFIFPKP